MFIELAVALNFSHISFHWRLRGKSQLNRIFPSSLPYSCFSRWFFLWILVSQTEFIQRTPIKNNFIFCNLFLSVDKNPTFFKLTYFFHLFCGNNFHQLTGLVSDIWISFKFIIVHTLYSLDLHSSCIRWFPLDNEWQQVYLALIINLIFINAVSFMFCKFVFFFHWQDPVICQHFLFKKLISSLM